MSKKKNKSIHKNEIHMKTVQDLRRSNFSGTHGGTPAQRNRKDRKQSKQNAKSFVDFFVDLWYNISIEKS